MCRDCGWPASSCRCSATPGLTEPIPARIVAKLRIEKKGRGGKTVTVVDGLPRNSGFLEALCLELKRACGTGGSVLEGAIDLHGDLRHRAREVLLKRGYTVKG